MKEINQVSRVLEIYTRLIEGEKVIKRELAAEYETSEKTIQRDIDEIRRFLSRKTVMDGIIEELVYDFNEKKYYIENKKISKFSDAELLAICKILLDSRAFKKEQMDEIISKLIDGGLKNNHNDIVKRLIDNEKFHYTELCNATDFFDTLWKIGAAIQKQNYIEIEYGRLVDKKSVKRKLRPAAIMFSEFYFYMVAFIDDEDVRKNFEILEDSFPTIYRIDRIKKIDVLSDKFHILYKDRFEEGEFRKRIQFMFGGKLQRIKFKYKGYSIEAVLDRLPTAKVLWEEDGVYMVSAEVFGNGIDMWLRSQGDLVERVE